MSEPIPIKRKPGRPKRRPPVRRLTVEIDAKLAEQVENSQYFLSWHDAISDGLALYLDREYAWLKIRDGAIAIADWLESANKTIARKNEEASGHE